MRVEAVRQGQRRFEKVSIVIKVFIEVDEMVHGGTGRS
jgi:hypothetical protein